MSWYRARILFDLLPTEQGGPVGPLASPVRSLHIVPEDPEVLAGTPYDSIAGLIFVDGGSAAAPGQQSVAGVVDFMGGDEIRGYLHPGSRVQLRTVSRVVGHGVVGDEVSESAPASGSAAS